MNISIKNCLYPLIFPVFLPASLSNHLSQRSFIMRKYILSLAIIFQFAFAQQAEVTNVTVAQRTDGSKIVDITYDLTEDAVFTEFDITIEVSLDDGATYTQISQVSAGVYFYQIRTLGFLKTRKMVLLK